MKAAQIPSSAGHATRCRICGKPASPGAALCGQCRAAVKRARQVPTVMSRFMPLAVSASGSASGSPAPSAARARPAAGTPRRHAPGGSTSFMVIAALGLAVCVGGYFLALEDDDLPPPEGIVAAGNYVHRFDVSRPSLAPPERVEGLEGLPVETQPTGSASVAANAAKGASHRAGSGPRSSASAPAYPGAGSAPVDADGALPAAPAPESGAASVAAAAPNAPEQTVPDRWQAMDAAIAACGRENFFAAVICEQRARLRYCDGFWGDVPQCGKRGPFDNSH